SRVGRHRAGQARTASRGGHNPPGGGRAARSRLRHHHRVRGHHRRHRGGRGPVIAVRLVLALALILATSAVAAVDRGPIRIGMLVPQTGPLAANGREMENGFRLYLEEQGQRIGGREIKLFVEDTEAKPATALTKARALIESQSVQLLVGPLSTAEAYALLPYIEARKIPTLSPTVAAEDLTQRRRSQYVVRTGWSAGQPAHPFGPWVVEMLKYRKIAIVAQDFAFGHESSAAFQRTFEEAGGQIVQKLFAPLGTADYGPYLARLRRDVDAVYAAAAGADALRFVRQYADAGLKERLPLIGSGNFTDEHVLRNMDDTALGIVTALHYSAARADHLRRLRASDPEHLRAAGGARRRQAPEHRDPHVPQGLPVLDLQAGRVPEESRLLTGLAALQGVLSARRR